jgi:hypothetical protein
LKKIVLNRHLIKRKHGPSIKEESTSMCANRKIFYLLERFLLSWMSQAEGKSFCSEGFDGLSSKEIFLLFRKEFPSPESFTRPRERRILYIVLECNKTRFTNWWGHITILHSEVLLVVDA